MLKSQELLIEQSKLRQRTSELLGKDDLTTEERTELDGNTTRLQEIETEYRAALTAEGVQETNDDPENRELQRLHDRVQFCEYVDAALEMRGANGAALELNQALNIPVTQFPLSLLAPDIEERATTDADTATRPRRWLDRLFNQSMAARLGITMESVEPGVASFPVTTAGAAGEQKARGADADAAAWTVGVTELKPTRAAVHLEFTKEDAARIPSLEDALTRDLRMALMDSVDLAIFNGDAGPPANSGARIVGLKTAVIGETEITQANKVKGGETLAAFANLVDGKHAESLGDLRIVSSVGANVLWLTTIINAAAENQTLAQFLMASGLSWSTRGDIDTATAAGDFGAYVGMGRGIDGAAVAAIWNAGELIRDPYTKAKSGEVLLTVNYLWAFGLPRPSNFRRIKFAA